MNKIKCNRCKVELPETDFEKKRSGNFYKQCNQCRKYAREYAKKNKCEHNKQKYGCKDCGGSAICEHNKRRARCKDCRGGSICEHNKCKYQCKDCGGGGFCEHNRQRARCRDCGGSSICEHNKNKGYCKECGGSQICEHDKIKQDCRDCNGSSFCIHDKYKRQCSECDPQGHLSSVVSRGVRRALKSSKSKRSIEYLGCDIQTFREHIEKQFKENMTWENYGEWHIDHITPLKYENPTIEEVMERLHYTNTQPLWAKDNISKSNRFIG